LLFREILGLATSVATRNLVRWIFLQIATRQKQVMHGSGSALRAPSPYRFQLAGVTFRVPPLTMRCR